MGKAKKKGATKQKPLNLDMTFEEAIRRSIQTKIPKKEERRKPTGKMGFVHVKAEVKRWHIDEATYKILKELEGTGIDLQGSGAPTLQPIIRAEHLPIATLTLRWEYEVLGVDQNVVLSYILEDSYDITVKTLSTGHVQEIVALSYDRLAATFDELDEPTKIDVGILEPSEAEFDQLCQHVIQFLKEKLSKPGRR